MSDPRIFLFAQVPVWLSLWMGAGIALMLPVFKVKGRMIVRCMLLFVGAISVMSCSATKTDVYSSDGHNPICQRGVSLGSIVVLPEVAWRKDQKEPERRKKIAYREIGSAFKHISCGEVVLPTALQPFSNWSARGERKLLRQFSRSGFDTVVFIRIEELTPRLDVTFSLPFLWFGYSEADFRLRVVSVRSGTVLGDMRVRRMTGGPFNVRPAEWSGNELSAALRSVLQ